MDILTYNQILDVIGGIANRHLILKDFDIGKNDEFATAREYLYPMMYVTPVSGTFFKSEQNDSYPVKEIKIELKVLDLVNKGTDNLNDVHSDTFQILTDFITEINESPVYQEGFLSLVGDVILEPLEEWSDDEVSGWMTTLTLRMKNSTSFCGLPITETPVLTTPVLTYNQILAVLKDIQERHFQLKSFGVGKNWNYAASVKPIYPSLWVTPKSGSFFKSSDSDSYPVKEIQMDLKVLDLVNKGQDNQDDVNSDTFQILTDIITEINEHPYYQAGFLSLVGDITLEPMEEWSDEEVSGWMTTLTLRLKQNTSYCDLPIQSIPGEILDRQFDDSFDLSFL